MDIKKLAKALHLSTSTVSRAFRDNSDINANTKERILAMAKEMNYQPNHYASNMREQKSKTIAVIVPELSNNYFSLAIQAIERVASAKGYHILVYATNDQFEKEVSFIKHLHHGRADGIIMSVSGEANDHNYLNELSKKRLPLVFFDRVYEDIVTPRVVTNDYESSFKATKHLIQQGCKQIAYLAVNRTLSIGKTRMQGYIDALKKSKIPFNEELIIDCSNNYKENIDLLKEAFTKLKPDGVFTSVERLAFAAYYACYENNLSIPDDIKVIGFSSLEIAPLLNPALSTVTQPAADLGKTAAELLFKMLEHPAEISPETAIVLNSKMIQRKSTSTP